MRGYQRWVEQLRTAIAQMRWCCVLRGPTVDYDRDERWSSFPGHPCGDVPIVATVGRRLVSVRASVQLVFELPFRGLPQGYRLRFFHDGAEGLWVFAPGIDEQDPEELTEIISEDSPGGRLRETILQELAGEQFTYLDEWRDELSKKMKFRCSSWCTEAAAEGLYCTVDLEVEAEF